MEYRAAPGRLLDMETPGDMERAERCRWLDTREVLVVGKRGRGVGYAQDGGQLDGDIRGVLGRMCWGEVMEGGGYVDPEDWPADFVEGLA